MISWTTLVCLLFLNSYISVEVVNPNHSYDLLFKDGLKEYKRKNYTRSVVLLNEAIADYDYKLEISAQCWIKCQEEFTKTKLRYVSILDGQLNFLHYSIRMKACCNGCKEKFLGKLKDIDRITKESFKTREPYKYLMTSYSKMDLMREAIACAYTYLESNPEDKKVIDKVMKLEKKAAITSPIQSLNEPRHIALYRLGEIAYSAKNYTSAIANFEESHVFFFKEIDKCIAQCEEELEVREFLHTNSLLDHYRQLIACRQHCRRKQTKGHVSTKPDLFVQNYYDYLQFSYWHVRNPLEAAKVALSFLYLVPNDERMLRNLKYYRSKISVKVNQLKPRAQAVKFYRQLSLESSLVIIAKELVQPDENIGVDTAQLDKLARQEIENVHEAVLYEVASDDGLKGDSEVIQEDQRIPKKNHFASTRAYRNQGRWKNNPNIKPAELFKDDKELNGTNRVAFDKVIDAETCALLKKLVQKTATSGDGYHNRLKDANHPFTQKELFTGITVDKAVDAYGDGRASYDEVALYFNVSDKVRLITQEYFNLEKLNIAYHHLVCREALPGRVSDEEHFSHPVHSDNCNINGDGPGTCPKKEPSYTWRDYSAVLYLNDDFVGGDFIFADFSSNIQSRLKATCGRMVAFHSNGGDNLHGVLGVKSGTRCAMPLWFTLSDVSEDKRADHEKKLEIFRKQEKPVKEEL